MRASRRLTFSIPHRTLYPTYALKKDVPVSMVRGPPSEEGKLPKIVVRFPSVQNAFCGLQTKNPYHFGIEGIFGQANAKMFCSPNPAAKILPYDGRREAYLSNSHAVGKNANDALGALKKAGNKGTVMGGIVELGWNDPKSRQGVVTQKDIEKIVRLVMLQDEEACKKLIGTRSSYLYMNHGHGFASVSGDPSWGQQIMKVSKLLSPANVTRPLDLWCACPASECQRMPD